MANYRKIEQCHGNGQGQCNRCKVVNWTPFLYQVEGMQGVYCSKCLKEMGVNTMSLVSKVSNINDQVVKADFYLDGAIKAVTDAKQQEAYERATLAKICLENAKKELLGGGE